MTPSELANKIAEEVFRTIEREKAIVKAEIVEGIERILTKELRGMVALEPNAKPVEWVIAKTMELDGTHMRDAVLPKLGEWKIISKEELSAMQAEAEVRHARLVARAAARLLSALPELPEAKSQTGDWRKMVTAALDQFDQRDGPPMAYYELPTAEGVRRYTYAAFAWQSDSTLKIAQRVDDLADQLKSLGARTIIWRTRPEIVEDQGRYKFYCRFHVLPYVALDGFKREGEETPEA